MSQLDRYGTLYRNHTIFTYVVQTHTHEKNETTFSWNNCYSFAKRAGLKLDWTIHSQMAEQKQPRLLNNGSLTIHWEMHAHKLL